MKRYTREACFALVCASLFGSCSLTNQLPPSPPCPGDCRQETEALRKRIATLQTQLAQLEELRQANKQLSEQLGKLQDRIVTQQQQLDDRTRENTDLQERVQAQARELRLKTEQNAQLAAAHAERVDTLKAAHQRELQGRTTEVANALQSYMVEQDDQTTSALLEAGVSQEQVDNIEAALDGQILQGLDELGRFYEEGIFESEVGSGPWSEEIMEAMTQNEALRDAAAYNAGRRFLSELRSNLENLKPAYAVSEDDMYVGDKRRTELSITDTSSLKEMLKTFERMKQSTDSNPFLGAQNIDIGDTAIAHIETTGGLSSRSISQAKSLSVNRKAQWTWEVQAEQAEPSTVQMALYVPITINDREGLDLIGKYPGNPANIEIIISKQRAVKNFLATNWQWILSAIVSPLLISLWARLRGRKGDRPVQ